MLKLTCRLSLRSLHEATCNDHCMKHLFSHAEFHKLTAWLDFKMNFNFQQSHSNMCCVFKFGNLLIILWQQICIISVKHFFIFHQNKYFKGLPWNWRETVNEHNVNQHHHNDYIKELLSKQCCLTMLEYTVMLPCQPIISNQCNQECLTFI